MSKTVRWVESNERGGDQVSEAESESELRSQRLGFRGIDIISTVSKCITKPNRTVGIEMAFFILRYTDRYVQGKIHYDCGGAA